MTNSRSLLITWRRLASIARPLPIWDTDGLRESQKHDRSAPPALRARVRAKTSWKKAKVAPTLAPPVLRVLPRQLRIERPVRVPRDRGMIESIRQTALN